MKHGNTADGRTRCRLKRLPLQTASPIRLPCRHARITVLFAVNSFHAV
ncbi:group 2 glycosyl transferase [Neisseria meningitidis]|uniref:Uncharacterized protein n=1 Tax=Neisseria meningitidis serogroup B (strain ATCC 13091 / M2091) TaxID=862513 RepID=E0NCP4_NEIM3|nr:group 2 glycosyl transferase [Neisseria meningitidis]EFH24058.1 hypothetical protein NEIPOLOT_00175 [Neisseria polysaccharea ATCC 43768]EFM03313.1 hypothetical protein HMPREF0602_2276 [Neisseria meningitidis ATCC 13091]MBG8584327.1 group 2 glycosyl transferase [Neisseria meningitidis]MBG8587034.1 group 2 glycosyl transferase [Neisseria meningitidis]